MKKVLLAALFALFTSSFAHGVLLLVEDNGDGTIFIEAGLSTGGSAVGADVILRERASGRQIMTAKIPESGNLTVEQPKVAYTVTVNMGPGHSVTRNGPLAGEKRENKKKEHVHGANCKH